MVVEEAVHTDPNGKVIEQLIDERESVCMNDDRGKRVKVTTGTESV